MNAPDKIYVSRNFSEDNSPHGLWYLNKSQHDINVEYIRKDALLEWAKKEMGEWSSESNTAQCVKMGLTLVIDKIETL